MGRSGEYINVAGLGYKSFLPARLQDIEINVDLDISNKLATASRLLGKLDGVSIKIPNINLFISSYVRKEALMSSQIEGTQTSLVDVLDPNIEDNSNVDVLDVVKYTKALNFAIEKLNVYPLCNTLLKKTHYELITGTRGEDKCPGEFRHSQNWIGPKGCTLATAKYVPPTVENMLDAMSDLEKYINDENIELDDLIKVALIHYQFETIHPFLDGNGRIGRMLIVLYLMNKNKLSYPVLYISYFLKKNRVEYYDRLAEVRRKGDYEQWIKFFLDAVIETCTDSIDTIEAISELDIKNSKIVSDCSKSVKELYRYIVQNPIIEINKTAKELGFTFTTISNAVKKLEELNILKLDKNNKRNRVFSYFEYLEILKKDTENI